MRWAGTRSRYGGDEKLVQNLSRITFREEIAYDNDDVIEIAYETIERIKLAQDWDMAGSSERGNELPFSIKGGGGGLL
jgi:hypothetical protein